MILSYCYIEDADKIKRSELHKKQSEAAQRLLSEILHIYNVEKYTVDRDKNGRPYLPSHPHMDFNISHSGNIAVCVVSNGEGRVGVDVERNTGFPREKEFARRYFSSDEEALFESGRAGFAEIWTRKESYLKYVGIGTATKLKNVNTAHLGRGLRIETLCIGEYSVSVCLGENTSLEIVKIPQTKEGSVTEE